jgi:hypothetical protein
MIPGVSRAQFRIHVRRQAGATPSLRPYDLELQELGSQIPIWVDGVNAERASVALKDENRVGKSNLMYALGWLFDPSLPESASWS